jgi:flagellar hook protein FlgE
MDVIGNNIANSNTVAYKAARADFADALSQTLQGGSSAGGAPVMQVGSGVVTGSVKGLFGQGAITGTGVGTDLAISGEGFFVVRDSVSDLQFATRAGDFRRDNAGYLVTNKGLRVQGFTDEALSVRGDVRIDDGTNRPATSDPNASVLGFSISQTGVVKIRLSDNTEYVSGQILLQKFQNPQALVREGDNLYSGMAGAGGLGGAAPLPEAAGTNGLGQLQVGSLEMSNVELTNEFAGLITTQRGFQASARVITTSDEILQELVNLKR